MAVRIYSQRTHDTKYRWAEAYGGRLNRRDNVPHQSNRVMRDEQTNVGIVEQAAGVSLPHATCIRLEYPPRVLLGKQSCVLVPQGAHAG
jgi:hypothetical protein